MMSFVLAMEETWNVLSFIVVNLALYLLCESTMFVINYQVGLSLVCTWHTNIILQFFEFKKLICR